jgi:hypothetical protein
MTAILLEHFHGTVTRDGITEIAVPHRDQGWNLLIPSVWTDPPDTGAERDEGVNASAPHRERSIPEPWLDHEQSDAGNAGADQGRGRALPRQRSRIAQQRSAGRVGNALRLPVPRHEPDTQQPRFRLRRVVRCLFERLAGTLVRRKRKPHLGASTEAAYTTDGGTTWNSAFQQNQSLFRAITIVDVAPRLPERFVVGTGVKA